MNEIIDLEKLYRQEQRRWMREEIPHCSFGDVLTGSVKSLVAAYLDGSLSRSDRRRFRAHIRGCENCTAYVEQMRLMIEATGRLTEDDLDPAAREELLEAFRGWREGKTP